VNPDQLTLIAEELRKVKQIEETYKEKIDTLEAEKKTLYGQMEERNKTLSLGSNDQVLALNNQVSNLEEK